MMTLSLLEHAPIVVRALVCGQRQCASIRKNYRSVSFAVRRLQSWSYDGHWNTQRDGLEANLRRPSKLRGPGLLSHALLQRARVPGPGRSLAWLARPPGTARCNRMDRSGPL